MGKICKGTIILVIITILPLFVLGQGFQPPAFGKSVVYIAELNALGGISNFYFFNNDKFIGSLIGRGYFRYECDPGKQLFWASSENTNFLTADLLPNAIYVIIADVNMGFSDFQVSLRPVDAADSAVPKVEDMTYDKPSYNTAAQLAAKTEYFAQRIKKNLKRYDKLKSKGAFIPNLSPSMAAKVLVTNP